MGLGPALPLHMPRAAAAEASLIILVVLAPVALLPLARRPAAFDARLGPLTRCCFELVELNVACLRVDHLALLGGFGALFALLAHAARQHWGRSLLPLLDQLHQSSLHLHHSGALAPEGVVQRLVLLRHHRPHSLDFEILRQVLGGVGASLVLAALPFPGADQPAQCLPILRHRRLCQGPSLSHGLGVGHGIKVLTHLPP